MNVEAGLICTFALSIVRNKLGKLDVERRGNQISFALLSKSCYSSYTTKSFSPDGEAKMGREQYIDRDGTLGAITPHSISRVFCSSSYIRPTTLCLFTLDPLQNV